METGVNPAQGLRPVPNGKTASSRRFGRIDAVEPKRFGGKLFFVGFSFVGEEVHSIAPSNAGPTQG